MKKEFGKWLMDIAKYVTTAVLLSSWFSEVNDWEWYTYVLVVVSVVLTLAIGLGFVRYEEETIQSNKNKKGRSYGSKHHASDDYRNCRRRVLLFQWAQSS